MKRVLLGATALILAGGVAFADTSQNSTDGTTLQSGFALTIAASDTPQADVTFDIMAFTIAIATDELRGLDLGNERAFDLANYVGTTGVHTPDAATFGQYTVALDATEAAPRTFVPHTIADLVIDPGAQTEVSTYITVSLNGAVVDPGDATQTVTFLTAAMDAADLQMAGFIMTLAENDAVQDGVYDPGTGIDMARWVFKSPRGQSLDLTSGGEVLQAMIRGATIDPGAIGNMAAGSASFI